MVGEDVSPLGSRAVGCSVGEGPCPALGATLRGRPDDWSARPVGGGHGDASAVGCRDFQRRGVPSYSGLGGCQTLVPAPFPARPGNSRRRRKGRGKGKAASSDRERRRGRPEGKNQMVPPCHSRSVEAASSLVKASAARREARGGSNRVANAAKTDGLRSSGSASCDHLVSMVKTDPFTTRSARHTWGTLRRW